MANDQEMSGWTDLLHSSTKLLEHAGPSAHFPSLQVLPHSSVCSFNQFARCLISFFFGILVEESRPVGVSLQEAQVQNDPRRGPLPIHLRHQVSLLVILWSCPASLIAIPFPSSIFSRPGCMSIVSWRFMCLFCVIVCDTFCIEQAARSGRDKCRTARSRPEVLWIEGGYPRLPFALVVWFPFFLSSSWQENDQLEAHLARYLFVLKTYTKYNLGGCMNVCMQVPLLHCHMNHIFLVKSSRWQ